MLLINYFETRDSSERFSVLQWDGIVFYNMIAKGLYLKYIL